MFWPSVLGGKRPFPTLSRALPAQLDGGHGGSRLIHPMVGCATTGLFCFFFEPIGHEELACRHDLGHAELSQTCIQRESDVIIQKAGAGHTPYIGVHIFFSTRRISIW